MALKSRLGRLSDMYVYNTYVGFERDMVMPSKSQVIRMLDEELLTSVAHELHDVLVSFRVDPAPLTIHAVDSASGIPEFQGWLLFENTQLDDCIGYCDDPWGDGWSYFHNSLRATRRGDFSAALFGQSIGQILDQMITLAILNQELEQEGTQPDGVITQESAPNAAP